MARTSSINVSFDEPVCKIVHKDGKSYLTDPDGNILPKQLLCRVTQNINEPAYALVKIFVNLTDTEKT